MDSLADLVRAKLSIRQVCPSIGHGVRVNCVLPGHTNDISKDLFISDIGDRFYCHKCKVGGDVIKFISVLEDISYRDALNRASELADVRVLTGSDVMERVRLLDIVLEFYKQAYQDCDEAHDYVRSRGWDVDKFGTVCGYAPKYHYDLPCDSKLAIKHGLLKDNGLSHVPVLRDRLVFPIYDRGGNLLQLTGRSICDATPKVLPLGSVGVNQWKFNNFLYNEKILSTHIDYVFIVEGQTDSYTLQELGINVVGLMGNVKLASHAYKFANIRRVYLMLDNDEATSSMLPGQVYAFLCSLPAQHKIDSFKVVELPSNGAGYKDINQFLLNGVLTIQQLYELCKTSRTGEEFLIDKWSEDKSKNRFLIEIIKDDQMISLFCNRVGITKECFDYARSLLC